MTAACGASQNAWDDTDNNRLDRCHAELLLTLLAAHPQVVSMYLESPGQGTQRINAFCLDVIGFLDQTRECIPGHRCHPRAW